MLLATGFLLTNCQKSETVDPFDIKLATSSTLGSYLTDKAGNTLYFFAQDANGLNNCTGGCATAWPIFTVASLTMDKLAPGLAFADFGTINVGTGNQVTYKGWPLYYYGPDADALGVFRGKNTGISVPKPNVWPVLLLDTPPAPKK